MTKCESFKPSINKNSSVLILGSMPGVKSLQALQYYAHPQNRFWKVMGFLCNESLHEQYYNNRLQILLNKGFALWDTIKSCERSGSLDSNISNEIPNDIEGLLKKYSMVKTICLNGNKAYSAFKKHFPHILRTYRCIKLPSTSPANAKYSLEDLYTQWKEILKYLQKT